MQFFTNPKYDTLLIRQKILVSVITPIYNRKHTILRTLNSLKNQTYTHFECILVDDGSTDGIDEVVTPVLQENILPIIYIKKQNGGVHTARNCAIKEARGEMIVFLDSDDELTPNALEIFLKTWETIPSVKRSKYREIVAQCMDENGKRVGKPFPSNINQVNWKQAVKMCDECKGEHVAMNVAKILKDNPWPEPKGITFVQEGVVWKKLEKTYKSFFINDMVRIYHSDSGNSYTFNQEKNLQTIINRQWGTSYYLNNWNIYQSKKNSFFKIFFLNEIFSIILKKYKKTPYPAKKPYLLCLTCKIPCLIVAKWYIKKKMQVTN